MIHDDVMTWKRYPHHFHFVRASRAWGGLPAKWASNAQWFETAQRAGDAPFTAQPRISKDAALKILAKQEENDSKTI